MPTGYALDPGVLRAVAADLGEIRTELDGQQASLGVHPDAGASRNEVASAFSGLSSALGALAGALGQIAAGVTSSVETYQRADRQVGSGFAAGTP